MKKHKKVAGVLVPLVTPVNKHGQVDEPALERLIHYVTRNGCQPFLLGTTGEYTSLTLKTRQNLVKFACSRFKNTAEIYANVSSNCFQEMVETAHLYHEWGVKAVVAHVPNYYPLTEAQMLHFFEQLIEHIPGDLILYNIPVTTHHSLPVEVIQRLSQHERIVGLKDSERDLNRLKTIIGKFRYRDDFSYLVGWGAQMALALEMGADGLVPSTGNLSPRLYSEMMRAAQNQNWNKVRELQAIADVLSALYQKDRFLGESLAALKVLLSDMGLLSPSVILPLTELPEKEQKILLENFAQKRKLWGNYIEEG